MSTEPPSENPALMDTITIKRKERRSEHAASEEQRLPKVPQSLWGRVLCAHPEIVTALAALGMALIFILPKFALTIVVMVAVLAFAFGWAHLTHLPARRISFILLAIVGVLVVGTAHFFEDFSIVAEAVGFGIIGAFLAEMFRNPRPYLLASVSGNIAGILVISTAGAWIMLENGRLWYFLMVPGALTLLGGCVGLAMSANWRLRWRVVVTILTSVCFGVGAGAAIMLMGENVHDALITFAGGHLPTFSVALLSGLMLGIVVGTSFAVLAALFSGDLAPSTVRAAVAQAVIPVLAAAIPIYILARLLVGDGPTLT